MEDAVDLLGWLFLGTFELACPPSCRGTRRRRSRLHVVACNTQGYPEYTHDRRDHLRAPPRRQVQHGEPGEEPSRLGAEGPVHEVTLSAFLIAKYELTQGQWQCGHGDYPSYFDGTKDRVETL